MDFEKVMGALGETVRIEEERLAHEWECRNYFGIRKI